ncbi:MAG: hypothetical protein ACTHQM_01745 [Thermoanaerobaculia bacterium]
MWRPRDRERFIGSYDPEHELSDPDRGGGDRWQSDAYRHNARDTRFFYRMDPNRFERGYEGPRRDIDRESGMRWNRDARDFDRGLDRGGRDFSRGDYDRNFDRGMYGGPREFDRGMYGGPRDYDRGMYGEPREFNRGGYDRGYGYESSYDRGYDRDQNYGSDRGNDRERYERGYGRYGRQR